MQSNGSVWGQAEGDVEYPSIAHDLHVDVAVVGGGITGITAAALLKQSGRSVAVLEGRRI